MVDSVDRGLHVGDVAEAPALRHQPAARLQRRIQAREQQLVVGDPVERGGRDDRVDRPVKGQLEQVGREHLGAVAEPRPRLLDHRRTAVDGDDRAVGHTLDQQLGDAAGAAAGVEHALVAAQVEPIDHVARHRHLRVRHPVVGGGVPLARRHTRVRYRIRLLTLRHRPSRSRGGRGGLRAVLAIRRLVALGALRLFPPALREVLHERVQRLLLLLGLQRLLDRLLRLGERLLARLGDRRRR